MSMTAVTRETDSPPSWTHVRPAPREAAAPAELVGESDSFRYVMSRIDRVADTDATVLLLGETGTGKELFARELHRRSRRHDRPFVVVNCAALPASLIESELFGHERGAFTGAHAAQIGRFELAHHGTLFLDEVGELPLELQSRLLRALQNRQIERLGNPRPVDVDARVIAATNRNLTDDIRAARFRRDLFYRLNVFPISVPALRDRRSDIAPLARHFVTRFNRQCGRRVESIPTSALQLLESHDWPGNIRELENVIHRAVILSAGATLELQDVEVTAGPQTETAPCGSLVLVDVERRHILQVLEGSQWKVEGPLGAARILGLKASTLRSRMAKLGVARPR